jgi:galactose mutarotase-like enzyme
MLLNGVENMLTVLENEKLKVQINSIGAELWSVIDKKTGYEYIWQGNESVWEWRAPILFPQCGAYPDRYIQDNRRYHLQMHGFAREKAFSFIHPGTFCLESDKSTYLCYPYDFSLVVSFVLNDRTLTQTALLTNTGKSFMPFSLGFHTGYNKFPDTRLRLGDRETLLDDEQLSVTRFFHGLQTGDFGLSDLVHVKTEGCVSLVLWSAKNGHDCMACLEPRTDQACTRTGFPFSKTLQAGATYILRQGIEFFPG